MENDERAPLFFLKMMLRNNIRTVFQRFAVEYVCERTRNIPRNVESTAKLALQGARQGVLLIVLLVMLI